MKKEKTFVFASISALLAIIVLIQRAFVDYKHYKEMYKMSLDYCSKILKRGKESDVKELVEAAEKIEPELEALRQKVKSLTFMDIFLKGKEISDELFEFERTVDSIIISSVKNHIKNNKKEN